MMKAVFSIPNMGEKEQTKATVEAPFSRSIFCPTPRAINFE